MSEHEISAILGNGLDQIQGVQMVHSLDYIMEFDDISLAYRFCLN